jgi:small-conductance mechanosensitive channel
VTPLPLQATSFVRNLLTSLVGETIAGAVAPILVFVVAFVAVYIVGRTVSLTVLKRVFDARGLDAHARKPLKKITNVVVAFVAIAVAFGLAEYGNFLQSLATIAAAATLAVGLATQDTISNFVAGVFIFTDRPFRIGDWIEWDGHTGVVEDISFRVTRVRTFDNELLTVPNSTLTSGVVKNPVAKDTLRLKVPFGIGYDDDVERASKIIVEEAEAAEDILDDPAPSVRLTELGDSAVVLQSRVWIADPSRADLVKTRADYVTSVKRRFDQEGVDFPYPNRTLGGTFSIEGLDRLAETAD